MCLLLTKVACKSLQACLAYYELMLDNNIAILVNSILNLAYIILK